jgi:primosomal replication protein N
MSVRLNRRRAIPAIVSFAIVAGSIVCLPESTQAQSQAQRQAQCELSAIGATRSAVALATIRTACNWLVVNEGSLLNESLRPFYLCLVQNLSGAQDDRAANAIVSACRAANSR